MAKNPERHTTADADESKHAKQATESPEAQSAILAFTVYVTNFDTTSVQRWGTPPDAPQGRAVQYPAMYLAAQTPTLDHPLPSDPEIYLTIRTNDPTFWQQGWLAPGTALQIKAVIPTSPPPPSELKVLPPRPVPGPMEKIA